MNSIVASSMKCGCRIERHLGFAQRSATPALHASLTRGDHARAPFRTYYIANPYTFLTECNRALSRRAAGTSFGSMSLMTMAMALMIGGAAVLVFAIVDVLQNS